MKVNLRIIQLDFQVLTYLGMMYRPLTLLRIVLGIIFISHSIMRIRAGTVGGFGEFLGSNFIPFGTLIAWGITLFELAGGLLLILDFKKKWIAYIFMMEITMGIILVHARQGWFVVGHSTGGIEYSLLLLTSLWVTARNE